MVLSFMPLLLLASQVAAFPNAARRAETTASKVDPATTTTAPTPWVSIYDDGTASTFTEHVTTNSAGQTTTVDAQPTGSPVPAGGSQDVFVKCDSSKYELTKTGNTQPWIPFCAPLNGTDWWYTGNYYVTWNPGYWARNSSVKIMMNYVHHGNGGKLAKSWETSNSYGVFDISPSEDWLLNQTALNSGEHIKLSSQPMYFTIADSSSSSDNNIQFGPTIVLTSTPTATPVDTSPRNRPPPTILGLAIGLPLIAVFAFGSLCSLHFCMSGRRKIGPVSIGGGRRHFSGRGYSGRAERRRKAAMGGQATYRDEVDDVDDRISPADARGAEWELANVKGGK